MASVLASENTKSHGRRDGVLAEVLRHGDPSLNPDEVYSFRSVKMLKNK